MSWTGSPVVRIGNGNPVDSRFCVDTRGSLTPVDGQSPLTGRAGYFRLQNTSPDWAVFLRSPTQGGIQEKKPRVTMVGDIGSFPVQDFIAFLGQSKWSGMLYVSTPGIERSLLLKDGEVRAAISDAAADRVGEIAIRLGYISRVHLERVLSDAPPSRLGKALIEQGLIKAHDLYKCLQEQISEVFHGMILAKEGTFTLVDRMIEDKALAHSLSISIHGLLMDSIRKIDEFTQFRKQIPHGAIYVIKKRTSDGTLEVEEDAMLQLVDGHHTIIELGQLAKMSEFDATRIIYRLIEGGFVQLSSRNVSAATDPRTLTKFAYSAMRTVETPLAPGEVDAAIVVQVFNNIFREVRNEVAQRGNLRAFLLAANVALKDDSMSASPVLTGLALANDGTLPEAQVLTKHVALSAQGKLGSEPVMSLQQALSDVMFFLLFQAGELIESPADEDLARRVKHMLAALNHQ